MVAEKDKRAELQLQKLQIQETNLMVSTSIVKLVSIKQDKNDIAPTWDRLQQSHRHNNGKNKYWKRFCSDFLHLFSPVLILSALLKTSLVGTAHFFSHLPNFKLIYTFPGSH